MFLITNPIGVIFQESDIESRFSRTISIVREALR